MEVSVANVGFYENHLKGLLTDPSSFQKTPGFQTALDTGMQGIQRSNSRMRGSGNVLAALTKYGTGLANQEYGNQVDRLGRLVGQEQGFALGEGQLDLGRDRLALDDRLGTGQLDLGRDRLGLDRELGTGQLGLGRDRLGLDRELGMGQLGLGRDRLAMDNKLGTGRLALDSELGFGRLGNERQSIDNDFTLGMDRNNLTAAGQQNDFNLGNRTADINWFNAQTNRGNAQSNDFYRGEESDRDWIPYTHAQGPGGYYRR